MTHAAAMKVLKEILMNMNLHRSYFRAWFIGLGILLSIACLVPAAAQNNFYQSGSQIIPSTGDSQSPIEIYESQLIFASRHARLPAMRTRGASVLERNLRHLAARLSRGAYEKPRMFHQALDRGRNIVVMASPIDKETGEARSIVCVDDGIMVENIFGVVSRAGQAVPVPNAPSRYAPDGFLHRLESHTYMVRDQQEVSFESLSHYQRSCMHLLPQLVR